MNAADLARLAIAKRAYRAVEPSAAEVQRGVRQARLSLRRPRARRAWFSKTLVAVVLAMGGLAYAKPHALGEWVGSALLPSRDAAPKRAGGTVAATPQLDSTKIQGPSSTTPALPAAGARAATVPAAPASAAELEPQPAPAAPARPRTPNAALPSAPTAGALSARAAFPASSAPVAAMEVASEWGRVGTALANGDEQRALLALKELSHSDDPRTRDKADLGRAQLLMANGERDQACALARNLTNRRAGGRIERQALVLLKSCNRYNR